MCRSLQGGRDVEKAFGGGRGEGFSALLQFFLLAMFAVFALLVTALSVRVCRRAEDMSGENRALRTGLAYVAGKIRAGDRAGAVTVLELEGLEVLAIREDYGGEPYVTYIYWQEGALWEYFSREEYGFTPESGARVLETGEMAFAMEDGAVVLTARTESGESGLRVALHAEGGGI